MRVCERRGCSVRVRRAGVCVCVCTVCMYICVHRENGRVGLFHWIPDTFKECEKMADIRRVNLKAISVRVIL